MLLIACEQPTNDSIDNSVKYKTLNRANRDKISIEVHWVSKSKISDKCKQLGAKPLTNTYAGCARSKPSDKSICEIYVVQPNGFNDDYRLEILGHEVYHCLGAKHD